MDSKFKERTITSPNNDGVSIYYTTQCPFAVGIIDELRGVAKNKGVPFSAHKITTKEEAQDGPLIWSTFGLFYNKNFITHEILSSNKFEKLLTRLISDQ